MHSVWVESLEQVRREDEWFKAANRGKDEDIEKMQDLIGEDPNRFYGDWDPRKLINSGRGGRLIGMQWIAKIARLCTWHAWIAIFTY